MNAAPAAARPTIQDVFTKFGPEYIERYGNRMPTEHRKVIDAIMRCRTGDDGWVVYRCEQCGKEHKVGRSCGNRHCPTCQNHKSESWLNDQKSKALPVPYFFITFTVPQEIRRFMRQHQRIAYGAFFKATAEAMNKLARDPKRLGAHQLGFTSILHTWGRQLQYHPHIHCLVAGGGLDNRRSKWLASRKNYFLPVKALSKLVRGIFKDEMHKAGLLNRIPRKVWKANWNVNSQAVGESDATLNYMARYSHKVAISNHRIVKLDGREVTFRYRKKGTKVERTSRINVMEFIRRYLQHVLPSGFVKIRHYGFHSPNCRLNKQTLEMLIVIATGKQPSVHSRKQDASEKKDKPQPKCPGCGGRLMWVASEIPLRSGRRLTITPKQIQLEPG